MSDVEELVDDLTCLCVEVGGVCDLPVCKCKEQEEGTW